MIEEELTGPFYYKLLKDGSLRFVESKPKVNHAELWSIDVGNCGQHKWFFIDVYKKLEADGAWRITQRCDYENVCGYDRGPRFERLMRRILG